MIPIKYANFVFVAFVIPNSSNLDSSRMVTNDHILLGCMFQRVY